MNIALWVAQVALAAAFGMAGVMKTTQPISRLAASMKWPGDIPPWLVRFIGTAEALGAIGLIAPALTGIATWLVPLAGLGLAVVMLLASGFHIRRGEAKIVPMNAVLLILAAFVAYGRWIVAPL